MKNNAEIIERTGENYNEIIFEDDYIPKDVYIHQIQLRNEIIDKCLSGKKFKYVLDLGCGTGFHLKTLNQYAETLIGVDMSFGALKQSKKSLKCEYVVCDVNRLPFKPNTIDCIWIAGVLHHVPNDLENVIGNNITDILKEGGVILIDEPNKLNPFNFANMKLSKADPTGNERPLSLSRVKELLIQYDFEILSATFYEHFSPLGVLTKNRALIDLVNHFDDLLNKTFLRIFSLRWIIYAKKNQ
jgi:SAM-dependent methyltransferase